jgi:hypothetical protein
MRTLEIFNCRHDFLLTSGLILSQHVSISYHIVIRAFANSIRRASPHTKLTIIFRPILWLSRLENGRCSLCGKLTIHHHKNAHSLSTKQKGQGNLFKCHPTPASACTTVSSTMMMEKALSLVSVSVLILMNNE